MTSFLIWIFFWKVLKLIGIVDALPCKWKEIIISLIHNTLAHIQVTKFTLIYITRRLFYHGKISSQPLYNTFKKRKQVPPCAPKKVNEKFPELQVSWKELYLLHLGRIMTVQRSKSSFFLIASIHDYVFWNYWLLLFWKRVTLHKNIFKKTKLMTTRNFSLSQGCKSNSNVDLLTSIHTLE